MNHIVKKHKLDLAIIYWSLDCDYLYLEHEEDDLGVDYFLNIDVYNIHGELVFEDALGGVQIIAPESSSKFVKEIYESAVYHFGILGE